jgi:Zn finger protein HypA/HybF involved in hydrogenase expression
MGFAMGIGFKLLFYGIIAIAASFALETMVGSMSAQIPAIPGMPSIPETANVPNYPNLGAAQSGIQSIPSPFSMIGSLLGFMSVIRILGIGLVVLGTGLILADFALKKSRKTRKCPRCKTEVGVESANFCPTCGERLEKGKNKGLKEAEKETKGGLEGAAENG